MPHPPGEPYRSAEGPQGQDTGARPLRPGNEAVSPSETAAQTTPPQNRASHDPEGGPGSSPAEHDDAVYDDGTSGAVEERSDARLVAVVAAIVAVAVLAGLLMWHPWSRGEKDASSPSSTAPSPSSVPATTSSYGQVLSHPSRMFRAGNVYSTDITGAPLASNSPAMVKGLTAQVRKYYGGNGTLNYDQYHGTLWVADKNTKKVTVGYDNCQKKKKGEYEGLLNGPKYFVDVPIPTNAVPAKGTDGQLAVWSPTENKLWELWVAKKKGTKWTACWGGRIDNVSQSMGQMPYGFGASASGLAVTGSMISVDEAKQLKIDHAMGLNIPAPANWPNWSYPANRTDGFSKDADAIPEGSRIRLDPSVNVDSLNMSPLAKAIAKAAQTYGFIVTDKSGAVAVVTEGGERRMVNAKGATVAANPWKSVLKGADAGTVLKGFPWDKLQVVQKDWGKPAGSSEAGTK